jgi:Uma2 family endonuclease
MIHSKTKYTPEEYLAREAQAEYKSEYYDGEIRMMAGGTEPHSIIAVNTIVELGAALKHRPCKVFNSDMRLLIGPMRTYTYPDAMVICGKTEFQAGRNDVVTNPIVIVEVLSPSTREHDRIEKFALYKQIESVREYVMIDSERMVVFLLRRESDGRWTIEILTRPGERLVLDSLELVIPIETLYAKVEFPTEAAEPSESP